MSDAKNKLAAFNVREYWQLFLFVFAMMISAVAAADDLVPHNDPIIGIADYKLRKDGYLHVNTNGAMENLTGIEIVKFSPNSLLEAAGLRKADVILNVNGKKFFEILEFNELMAEAIDFPSGVALVKVRRNGQFFYVFVTRLPCPDL